MLAAQRGAEANARIRPDVMSKHVPFTGGAFCRHACDGELTVRRSGVSLSDRTTENAAYCIHKS